jgi:hypothetical protein
MATNEKLDKDRFRRDLGGEAEAYQEVARRLGLLPKARPTWSSTSTSNAPRRAQKATGRKGTFAPNDSPII